MFVQGKTKVGSCIREYGEKIIYMYSSFCFVVHIGHVLGHGAEDRRPVHLAETHRLQNPSAEKHSPPVKPHQTPPTLTQATPTQAHPTLPQPAPSDPLTHQSNPPPPPPPPSYQALSSLSSPEPLNNLSLDAPPHQPSHSLTTDNLATLRTSSRASTVLGGGGEDEGRIENGEGGEVGRQDSLTMDNLATLQVSSGATAVVPGGGGGDDGGGDGGGGGEDGGGRGESGQDGGVGRKDPLTRDHTDTVRGSSGATAVPDGGGEDVDSGRQGILVHSGGLGVKAQEKPLTFIAVEQTESPHKSQPETSLPHNQTGCPSNEQTGPAASIIGLATAKLEQPKLKPPAHVSAATHPKPPASQPKLDGVKSKLSQSTAPSGKKIKVVRPQISGALKPQYQGSSDIPPRLPRDSVTPSPEHQASGMQMAGTSFVCIGTQAKDPFRGGLRYILHIVCNKMQDCTLIIIIGSAVILI